MLKRNGMYSVLRNKLMKSIYILDKAYSDEMEIRNEGI